MGATLALWDAQVGALLPRYRVLRYDIRGHGGSEVPKGPYTLEQMAEDLRGLLDRLGIAETAFVGLSMGGLIGMTAALADPARITRLVLCDTTAHYGPAVEPMWHERMRVAEAQGMTEALIEGTMGIWFSAAFRAEHPEAVERVRAMLRGYRSRGLCRRRFGRSGSWTSPSGSALSGVRRWSIVGEKDPGTPPAMARVLHERIPGARLLVLPGAMHCSAVESAAEFNRALVEFLRT